MSELLYDIDSAWIAVLLFVSMATTIEIGLRAGRRRRMPANEAAKEHIDGIQSAMLGILALLLGFTFSLSLQRFDSRSEAVVDEANAIGTAWLRTQLLPATVRDEAQALLREYTGVRVQASTLTLADHAQLAALMARAAQQQTALWAQARRALELDPNSYTPILFIESVNQLIDSFGKRDAALQRHVPEFVLMLLYATFLMAGAIVGYACGVGGHRPSMASYIMVALIVVLVFIILDLDRPRRGLIQVSQKSLVDLQAGMRSDAAR